MNNDDIGHTLKSMDLPLLEAFLGPLGFKIDASLDLLFLITSPEGNSYGIYYEGGFLRINNAPNSKQEWRSFCFKMSESLDAKYDKEASQTQLDTDEPLDIIVILKHFFTSLEKF